MNFFSSGFEIKYCSTGHKNKPRCDYLLKKATTCQDKVHFHHFTSNSGLILIPSSLVYGRRDWKHHTDAGPFINTATTTKQKHI